MKKTILFSAALTAALLAASLVQAHDDDDAMGPGMMGGGMMEHGGMGGGMGGGMMAFGHPAAAAQAGRSVAIEMKDMAFVPDSLTVKAGETVLFKLHNGGTVMHEFMLGTAAMQTAHRRMMAAEAEKGLPPHHHHMGNAVSLDPGQSASLAWTFTQPGTVEYDCNLPGHYESGMKGAITVTP